MLDNKDLAKNRRRAYHFIKSRLGGVTWVDVKRDDKIADTLGVKLTDLISLKEGKANPSAKLVEKIKEWFKDDPDSTLAEEIAHKLVEPFKQR
jgi:DNA-binding XRE family transcriptional regulator